MKRNAGLIASLMCLLMVVMTALGAEAQQRGENERTADGVFIVTLKSPTQPKMTVDELVRDRDLNPRYLYRVKTGGYIGFDQEQWVDKLEFKVFDKPVTELVEYKRFSRLLVEINNKIALIKQTLGKYDLLALRLVNICDRSRFSSLQAIDDNILQQLTVYRKLILLRAVVVNALTRFVRDRACRDLFTEYQKTLNIYSKQLAELTRNFDRLSRKTRALTRDIKPQARKGPGESEASPPKKSQ